MPITISLENGIASVFSEADKRSQSVSLTSQEKIFTEYIYELVNGCDVPVEKINLERHTDSYLSVVAFEVYDFCRIKVGPRSCWFSLFVDNESRSNPHNDTRLAAVLNKSQWHWKFSLKAPEEIFAYKDLIEKSLLCAQARAHEDGR